MDGTVEKTQLSLWVPVDLVESFELIAKALDRDRSWVMVRALRQYLDTEGADIIQEAAGLASLDRGEGLDFDSVIAEATAVIAQAKAAQALNADCR
jgi:predicted transcriptional regulator